MGDFPGFHKPEQNWSKLPHQLIEALPVFTSKGELAVVLYILRHTWGYQEYDIPKRITLDEFMHGRKATDSCKFPTGRVDAGLGMSKDAILRGLKRAEEDGFIEVEVDDADKARIKKYYLLRMSGSQTQMSESQTPEVRKSDSRGTKVGHRTEKETIERNPEEENSLHQKKKETIWDIAKSELRHQVKPHIFDDYLSKTQMVSHIGAEIAITAPDEHVKAWLENRLLDTIERTLVGVVGSSVKVQFVVEV